ncbi:MAG: DUF1553 domain-containing protein [Verrucomicrobia bacterium]|nr:DUF1553 domain-containing protein [Verrucomicrobiota bacterium]
MREIWDVALMGRGGERMEKAREEARWFDFLERSFRENRPWNDVLRDCLTARPSRPEDRGSVWYLYERTNHSQAIAEAVAPIVYGVQVKCAQCHDHMIAREIKQAHYWGLAAAFMRSKNVETPEGPALSESAIGGFVSFANLKKESQPATLALFNGRRVHETWPGEGEKEQDGPEKYRIAPGDQKSKAAKAAVPRFSRREAFAESATRDTPLLARATVNRMWALLFGRGLVHPVDLMDSKHPCSHPELLDWLAEDFASHGHDMKRLIRVLCGTRAYQLDSKLDVAAASSKKGTSGPPRQPDTFSRAIPRPLSAEQLFDSMWQATGGSDATRGGRSRAEIRRAFTAQFPDVFAAEYQATLHQAMFLANSPIFDTITAKAPGTLMERMTQEADPAARVRVAFQGLFHRQPEADELRECARYLAARPIDAGARQLEWALLTSAEFQLNH